MPRIIFRVVFIIIIIVIAKILQILFSGKSNRQKSHEKDGRIVMRTTSNACYIILALGIVMFSFVSFFVWLCATTDSDAWEQAGSAMLVCEGLGAFVLLMGIWLCYFMRANSVTFDGEKITIGRPFKAEAEMPWENVGGVEIQEAQCVLYDRNNKICLRVNANMNDFARFCQMAKTKVETNGGQVKRY